MAYEPFYGSHEHFWGWRCIFCGEIVDDVIIENRRWLKKGIVSDDARAQRFFPRKVKEVD